MFGNSDRSIRSGWTTAAVTVLVIAAVLGGSVFLMRSRQNAATVAQQDALPASGGTGTASPAKAGEPLPVVLFIPGNGLLDPVSAGIERRPELQLEVRDAAAAVLNNERGALTPVLKDVTVRALYLDAAGTAYLDLAPGRPYQKELHASAWDETLALYALVNTLTHNFPEVRQVRFLVDGREAAALAGHLDLSRVYVKRSDLVREAR